jgi:hypothetical protein
MANISTILENASFGERYFTKYGEKITLWQTIKRIINRIIHETRIDFVNSTLQMAGNIPAQFEYFWILFIKLNCDCDDLILLCVPTLCYKGLFYWIE